MPDSLALLQPNVELAYWLIDAMLYLNKPHTYSLNAFTRLCNCLRSANLPLKETIFRVLSRIFVKWVDMLQQDKFTIVSRSMASKPEDVVRQALELPVRASMIQEVLSRNVSMSRIQAAIITRMGYERRQERLFFSSFVRAAMDFIITLSKLQETLAEINFLSGTKDTDSQSKESLQSISDSQESTSSEQPSTPDKGEDTQLPQLQPPKLSQASDTAIVIQWHDSSFLSLLSCRGFSLVFELEVSDRSGPASDHAFRQLYRGPAFHYRMEGVAGSKTYLFRLRAVNLGVADNQVGKWSGVASIQTTAVAPFTFDRLRSGPNIFVCRDNLAASFANNEAWSTVLGTTSFLCGKSYWEIQIDKSNTSYLFIGVATKQADLGTFLGGDDFGWGYIGDRALYHKRAKVKTYGERFGEGDVIGVTLDMDRGTLSFKKNGMEMGTAFDGLAGELYPAVAFYNQGQRVSLIRASFCCSGNNANVVSVMIPDY